MAHNSALLRAWQDYPDHVVVRSTLGRQRSDVVILRTGHRLRAEYEWAHHVIRARGCGTDDARIAALRGPVAEMTTDDAVLAGAVGNLIDHACLGDARLRTLDAAGRTQGRSGPHGDRGTLQHARVHREDLRSAYRQGPGRRSREAGCTVEA